MDIGLLTEDSLQQFHGGTDNVWRHPLYGPLQYTDGVRAVALWGKAWWLLDIIATSSNAAPLYGQYLLAWTLTRGTPIGEGMYTAVLRCTDGNGTTLVFPVYDENTNADILAAQRDFSMTDFPLETITIWVIDQLMMLPSEY